MIFESELTSKRPFRILECCHLPGLGENPAAFKHSETPLSTVELEILDLRLGPS